MSTPSIVIASAGRTAVGSFNGAFANTPAHELGAAVISAVLERAGVAAEEVDEVILGQVLQAGEGQNPARQAAMKAGLPQEKTAWGMNQLCGSGLRAVALGMQQQKASAVARALVPIAIGHALAIGIVVLAAALTWIVHRGWRA